MSKPYFHKVKKDQEIFGLVFGHGTVKNVWGDGHYKFEVEFDNGFTVPYTEDGIPGWSGKLDFQTIYYKEDIDVMSLDFAPTDKVLSAKKIIKLRAKGKLEVKCPSGLWQPVGKCPSYVTEQYLEDGKLHLFRKTID
jgi:hypothetical protein